MQILTHLSEAIATTIRLVEPAIQALVPSIEGHELVAVTGSGSNIGVVLEAAIKIQIN